MFDYFWVVLIIGHDLQNSHKGLVIDFIIYFFLKKYFSGSTPFPSFSLFSLLSSLSLFPFPLSYHSPAIPSPSSFSSSSLSSSLQQSSYVVPTISLSSLIHSHGNRSGGASMGHGGDPRI